MKDKRTHGSWHTAGQCLLAIIAITLVTFICFRLQFNLAATAFLYLIIVVLLSLKGSLISSTAVSLIAVGCLAYYFAPPIFSFRVDDPFNILAIITFFLTSTVITTLVSRAHSRAERLVLTNANLEAQIAERKQSEERLRQSEERFRLVLESIGAQVITTTLEGELDFVNQPVLDYFGRTLEQLKGWRTADILHPDDLASAIAVWKDSIEKRLSYDVDHRFRRSDGVYRWFHVCGRPHRDVQGSIVRWYALLTDIEDRKRAEDKIREQEAEFRQIVDLAPQLVGVFGSDFERLYANRMTLDYHGVRLDEWRQLSRGSVTHPDDSERVKAIRDRASASGSAYEVELRLRKHDGNYRWFLARFNPVRDDQGRISRWYVGCTDIEHRKQAEDRLSQENVALREEIDKTSMFEEIVGTSAALKSVLSRISKVAPSDSTVLITGETGTGKELVARAIHRRSDRSSRAFVS